VGITARTAACPCFADRAGCRESRTTSFTTTADGTFTDVSKQAGVADDKTYYGITGVFVDVNNDGKPDLLVANDSSSNYLYLNKGDGTFEDASLISDLR
jgi:hypothetical protein